MLLPGAKRRRNNFMTEKKRYNQPEPDSFSAGQSGGDQGLPRDATADSESVEDLLEKGNSFEQALSSAWRTPKILAFPK
jgi:hypothetical protein